MARNVKRMCTLIAPACGEVERPPLPKPQRPKADLLIHQQRYGVITPPFQSSKRNSFPLCPPESLSPTGCLQATFNRLRDLRLQGNCSAHLR